MTPNKIEIPHIDEPDCLHEILSELEISLGKKWRNDLRWKYGKREVILKTSIINLKNEKAASANQPKKYENDAANKSEVHTHLNDAALDYGQTLTLNATPRKVIFANDTCVTNCLYIFNFTNTFFITDDPTLSIKLAQKVGLKIQYNQVFFWLHTRTTHSPSTIFEGMYKIPFGFSVSICEKGSFAFYSLDFHKYPEGGAAGSLAEVMKRDLRKIEAKEQAIVLFSGGADSVFIAKTLQQLNIDFRPVFFHPNAVDANASALKKALDGASSLGLRLDIRLVDIPSAFEIFKNNVDRFLLNRHASLLQIGGFLSLRDAPQDTVILNGQTADAIFSFGPSSLSKQDFLRRLMMTPIYRWALLPAFPIIKAIFKVDNVSWPKNPREFVLAAAYSERYLFAYPKNYRPDCFNLELTNSMLSSGKSLSDFIFFGKCVYMQGSDSQVVLQAAEMSGFLNTRMPFAETEIVKFSRENRRSIRELFFPKSSIRAYSRSDSAINNTRKNDTTRIIEGIMAACTQSNVSMTEYTEKAKELYLERMRQISGLQGLNWKGGYPWPL